MKRWLNYITTGLAALTLVACGGGGGGGGTSLFGNGTGGDVSSPAAVVASITLDLGGTSSITNSGSDKVTATVTAKDANNVVVSGAAISIRSDSGEVSVASTTTDSSGKVIATIGIGDNKANRTVQVTATSGTLSQVRSFKVTGAKINSTAVPSVIAPGASGEVQYQVRDVNGNPLVEQSISITSSVGGATATTDSNGVYTFAYTAPLTAGDLTISASAAGVTQQDTVTVQSSAGGSKPVVPANTIQSAFVEANPSVVTVNESGLTANRAAIRALFTGANNASIPNVRVRFDLDGDQNSVGGTFAAGSSVVYSDSNGEATTFYIPGTKASPTNGVTVRACFGYTDADLANNACPNQAKVTLTVASGAVSVSIGTNGTLIELNSGLQLAQDFVVTVNDSAGRAKSGVDVVPSVDLLSYGKGQWTRPANANKWQGVYTQGFYDSSGAFLPDFDVDPTGACLNEDRNRNGILESSEDRTDLAYGKGQGGNGNAQLDPRKSDVVVTVNGGTSAKTDANGAAVLRITYARNVAGWVKYSILVAAGGISGTEGRASWIDVLRVPLDDIGNEATPAFVRSPYGVQAGCQNPN